MNKIDKLVEERIQSKGWIKLLPTDKNPTKQPHRFRYTDGNSVSIIKDGALSGVYQGPYIKEKYKQVDWDTQECNCIECSVLEGSEEVMRISNSLATAARCFEGVSFDESIDIAHLQIDQADNGYKKVTFYYKITDKDIK